MRMYVKNGKKYIGILLPTGLVLNRFTATVAAHYLQKQGLEVTKEQLRIFIKTLNSYRRAHKDWVLAEVDSADGEHVFVKL